MRTRTRLPWVVLLALCVGPAIGLAAEGGKPRRPITGEPEWIHHEESKEVRKAKEKAAKEYVEGLRDAEEARGKLYRIHQLRAMAADDPESGEKAQHLAASAQVDLRKAKKNFVRATTLDPKNADAWNMLGYTLLRTGSVDAAIKAVETALALKPDHIGAHETLAECHLERGRIDDAHAELDWLQKRGNMATLETGNLQNAITLWTAENPGGNKKTGSGKP